MSQKFVELVERLGDQQKEYHQINKDNTDELFDRVEVLESKGIRPGGQVLTAEQREFKQEFNMFLRGKTAAKDFTLESKAVTIASATGGGNAAPEDLSRRILQRAKDMSPLRQVCRVDRAQNLSDYNVLVSLREHASGWVGESDSRTETATASLQKVSPTHGENYCLPKVSDWAMDDIFFDVEGWFVEETAREFAKQEGESFCTGDGSNKPTGFIGTPVSTGDDDSPARAFGVLQYVPTGVSGAFPDDQQASPPGNPVDVLVDTMFSLRAEYRANAVWVMNSNTMALLAKFKDADGRYLLRMDNEGAPSLLLGKRVLIVEGMPDMAANSLSVAFGDFSRGYVVVDGPGMKITRDDVTVKGQVLFYVRRRVGGATTDDHAIRVIKASTS